MKWIRSGKHGDALKPGAAFEKYTIVKLLGRGGMGSVYLVRHEVLDSLFALKILASDVASKNKQFVDRFIREAKLACKIRHPNLIAVHDAGKNPKNGLYYIVMDYVSGGSVRDLLKKTPRIPPEQALKIVTQVADALTAACAHHMVHRDIKPDNIMFAADGSVKLADLGIAKSTDEQDTMLTMASSVFGTPAYMSPEQARDSSKVDTRADIYSLGIVFYEMLAGQRPFSGGTTIQILSQVMDASNTPDIRQVCPETPPDLALLIAKMTDKDPEKRFRNPDILLAELKKIRIPPEIGAYPLRTRGEIAVGQPSAPDVTMPTVSDAPAPAPDVTMPTVSTEPVPAPAPAVTMPTMVTAAVVAPAPDPVPAPGVMVAAVSTESAAPDVTMPTMVTAAVVAPAPAPVPAPGVMVAAVSTESAAPDVTMPMMATAAVAPAPEPAPAAVAPIPTAPAVTAPAPTAPAVSAATAPAQRKKGRGILIVSIAAVCLVCLIGASLAVIFLSRRGSSPEPGPAQNPDSVRTVASRTDTQPGGTPVEDSPAVVVRPARETVPGTQRPPVSGSAGPVADVSRDTAGQTPASASATPKNNAPVIVVKNQPQPAAEMASDPLRKNQIVLLADTSAVSRKTKDILVRAFGAENVSFQEAEGMGRYKQLLESVVKSDPSLVVLCFARQYAEDGISASGYGTVIGSHADRFQDEGIPCMFIQPEEGGDDDVRLKPYLDAATDLCRQRSIPFLDAADLTDAKLVPLVRENRKAE